MINDDEDPTIVSNIMDEFRATAYRSSMLPNYVPRDKTSSVLSKARRLKFDECVGSRTSENPDKKLKLTTPVTNVSDGSSNGIIFISCFNFLMFSVDINVRSILILQLCPLGKFVD